MNANDRAALADLLPQKAYEDQRHLKLKKAYYFFNVYHPAIAPLYMRYREKLGISDRTPLSDRERTEFELALLNTATLEELHKYCTQEQTQKEKTHCPPVQR